MEKRNVVWLQVLFWLGGVALAVVIGFSAIRLYEHYTRKTPEAPFKIFRSPTNHDYSANLICEFDGFG
jgi:hypothetical protein